MRNICKILVVKPNRKRIPVILRHTGDNIKICVKGVVFVNVGWIQMAQERIQL
jgi:hypothetical protein